MLPELKALRDVRADDSIVIIPAYKVSAMIVINTEDYYRKIGELLNPGIFKQLTGVPQLWSLEEPVKDQFIGEVIFHGT